MLDILVPLNMTGSQILRILSGNFLFDYRKLFYVHYGSEFSKQVGASDAVKSKQ